MNKQLHEILSDKIYAFLKTRNADLHEIREYLSNKEGIHIRGKELSETCTALYRLGMIEVDSFECIDRPMSYHYNVILKAAKK